MGAPRKQDWREARRYRAWEMKQQGWKQQDIARALAVSESAVSQWLKRGREQGVTSLKSHPGPGPQPKVSTEQREQLRTMLAEGASAYGYHGAVWTSRRVIQRTFGVKYHRAHGSWLLRHLGHSVHKPLVRAGQRDETASVRWQDDRWPALKKKAAEEDRTIVFVDEAGFYLLPMAVRSYAPKGQTPLTHDHLWVMGAITTQGHILFQSQTIVTRRQMW